MAVLVVVQISREFFPGKSNRTSYENLRKTSNNFLSGGGSGGPGGGSGGPGGGSGGPGGRPSVPSVPSPFWSNAKNPGQNLVKNLAPKIKKK